MKNHILVIADFEQDKLIAIEQAAILAKAYDCSLQIINFCYEDLHGVSDITRAKQSIINDVHEIAANKLVNALVNKVDYNFQTIWEKNISLKVNEYVAEHHPLLVVKTGHRSEALFYTSTDLHLLRQCPAPIMIASNQHWHKAHNILAAVDLQTEQDDKKQLNEKILQNASIMAKQLNTHLHVCFSIPMSPTLRKLGLINKQQLEAKCTHALQDKINLLANNFGIKVENIHLKAGQPDKVITSVAAECKASLVVIGNMARVGFEQKLIGNTVESILRLVKCDVLVLKP